MSRIAAIDPIDTEGPTADFLSRIQEKTGSTPNFFRTLAHSTVTANAFSAFNGALAATRLTGLEREVIALTQAGFHGCPYCAAYHVQVASKLGAARGEAEAWLHGESLAGSNRALATFTRAMLQRRGQVTDADLAAFHEAGFSDEHVVELIAVVAANTFTNYLNLTARTDVDFPAVDMPER